MPLKHNCYMPKLLGRILININNVDSHVKLKLTI